MGETSAGLAYLATLPNFELGGVSAGQAFGLERILALLAELGSPQLRVPVIHLAGTKGKGSTAAMLAAILQAAGYRTGLFTQPHLVRVHERFQVDGLPIGDAALTAILLRQVRPAVERLERRGLGTVQQFEVQVALTLLWFLERAVDVAVLETGLGGRLDGTNVVPRPLVTVLTPIGHDHMQVLGDTLAQIAGEKAAIIKQGVPVVAAPQPEVAARVFEAVAAAHEVPLLLGGRDWSVQPLRCDIEGTRLSLRIEATSGGTGNQPQHPALEGVAALAAGGPLIVDLETSLLGAHQAINAGAAAVAALVAAAQLPRLDLAAVRRGLRAVQWPGRLQILGWEPTVVVDGAHTAESSAVLAAAMRDLFAGSRLILICGIQADKDIPAVIAPLAGLARIGVATRADHPRAAPVATIAGALRAAGVPEVLEEADPQAALQRAIPLAGPDDVILAMGSLYLVGAILAGRHA